MKLLLLLVTFALLALIIGNGQAASLPKQTKQLEQNLRRKLPTSKAMENEKEEEKEEKEEEEEEKEATVSKMLKLAGKTNFRVKRQGYLSNSQATELARTVLEKEVEILETIANKLPLLAKKEGISIKQNCDKKGIFARQVGFEKGKVSGLARRRFRPHRRKSCTKKVMDNRAACIKEGRFARGISKQDRRLSRKCCKKRRRRAEELRRRPRAGLQLSSSQGGLQLEGAV